MVKTPWGDNDVGTYIQHEAGELKDIHQAYHNYIKTREGLKVLDYGCGEGKLVQELLDRGATAFGYDTSGAIIEKARVRVSGNAILEAIESAEIPLPANSIDAVVSNLVLMMCSDRKKLNDVFQEIGRVSRDKFAFCIPHPCFSREQFSSYHNNFFKGYDYFDEERPYQFVLHHPDGRMITNSDFIDHIYKLETYFGFFADAGFSLEVVKELKVGKDLLPGYLFVGGRKKHQTPNQPLIKG